MDTILSPGEILLRLLAAAVAGVLLGINRDLKGKPTGMRTLGLVALGAATVAVSTVYVAAIQADPGALSRVLQGLMQGVLTGIAFLGAGAVLRNDRDGRAHGLTTAANVLVVAALGIACGIGAWWPALIATAIAFFLLAVLGPLEKKLERLAMKKDGETLSSPDE